MASDLFVLDDFFFSDALLAFAQFQNDSTVKDIRGHNSVQLENLSLSQLRNSDYSSPVVKKEEFRPNFDNFSDLGIPPQDFDQTAAELMRRSCSSNSLEKNYDFSIRPRIDCVLEPQNLHNQAYGIPIRKFSSTGDLQNVAANMQPTTRVLQSSTSTPPPLTGEPNIKAERYSPEERKERIDRYRIKRTQRNFKKTIKYVCRKTVADSRPRIRGRFARTDEEIPKAASAVFHRGQGENHLWNF